MRKLLANTQSAAINLFEAFQEALGDLHAYDSFLFSRPKTKAAISHKLAMYLERHLAEKHLSYEGYHFDVMLNHADILLHDRAGKHLVSIMVFHDYIPKGEVDLLKKKMVEGAVLTLAVAFLSGKDYLLVYRVGKETIDYYHYDLTDDRLSSRMMSKERIGIHDKEQLVLLSSKRRSRKRGKPADKA